MVARKYGWKLELFHESDQVVLYIDSHMDNRVQYVKSVLERHFSSLEMGTHSTGLELVTELIVRGVEIRLIDGYFGWDNDPAILVAKGPYACETLSYLARELPTILEDEYPAPEHLRLNCEINFIEHP